MNQLSFLQPTIWTVSNLTRYMRELLEGDYHLQDLWVEGEVSNLSLPSSGHMYFTLKDTSCSIRCVMWRNNVARQAFLPRNGEALEVHGSISIYETSGQYQLYADLIRPAGEGRLYQEFLQLKAKLQAEGLFDPARKREIPRIPRTIGIVTSPTGAALRDMLQTLQRRFPLVSVVLAPTQVQGDSAPNGIVAALGALNDHCHPDVILIARGGGSIEDLWAFNDEKVARAIAASEAPVICGVGHETDFTIADFTADVRAATPTAAAELATPDRVDLQYAVDEIHQRKLNAISSALYAFRWGLNQMESRLSANSPRARIRSSRQRLDELSRRYRTDLEHRIRLNRTRLEGFGNRLDGANPQAVLNRGYAFITTERGNVVRSVSQAEPGKRLRVQVSDGAFGARVEEDGVE